MISQKEDILFGTGQEKTVMNDIQHIVGDNIILKSGWSLFDYQNESNTVFVELKSRRIRHDAYPTALIGLNKVEACNDPTKKYWFCFNYIDGLYYIQYDKALFDTFERNDSYWRTPRTGCANREQRVVYIPVSSLRKYTGP